MSFFFDTYEILHGDWFTYVNKKYLYLMVCLSFALVYRSLVFVFLSVRLSVFFFHTSVSVFYFLLLTTLQSAQSLKLNPVPLVGTRS